MKIALLEHRHRHGTDTRAFIVPAQVTLDRLPALTNETMERLGFLDVELEREDEEAEWTSLDEVVTLPADMLWDAAKPLTLADSDLQTKG